jgi:membrane dipeptidase
MASSSIHDSSIIFDGLIVSKWGRPVFENMREGGLTAANCTICIWEGMRDTLLNIAQWKRWFDEHGDIIMPCRSVADIREAKALGKVGIVLGWQNSSGIEDRLDLLPIFKDLGVGFIQLTYNTQNYVASGCWEKHDGGLSQFGESFIAEMNRVGIVVDLSHVGVRSASDAIRVASKPCAYTHVCPAGLFPHPRNKTDDQLREMVDSGGFVGIAAYAPFMRNGSNSSLEDVVDLFEYAIDVCGEENVGIGTDFTEGQDEAFFNWIRLDKGYAQRMVPSKGTAPPVKGFESLSKYRALTAAMEKRWPEARVRAVLGENWLRFLERVW